MSWDHSSERAARARVMGAYAHAFNKGRPYYTDSHGSAIFTGPKDTRLQEAWAKSCAEAQERAASDPEAAAAWVQSQQNARDAYRRTQENWDEANRRIDMALIEDQKRRQELWDKMLGQHESPAATGRQPEISSRAHPNPEYSGAYPLPFDAYSARPSTGSPAGPYSSNNAEQNDDSVVDMLRTGAAAAGVATVGACATWVTLRKLLRRRKRRQQLREESLPDNASQEPDASQEEEADTQQRLTHSPTSQA